MMSRLKIKNLPNVSASHRWSRNYTWKKKKMQYFWLLVIACYLGLPSQAVVLLDSEQNYLNSDNKNKDQQVNTQKQHRLALDDQKSPHLEKICQRQSYLQLFNIGPPPTCPAEMFVTTSTTYSVESSTSSVDRKDLDAVDSKISPEGNTQNVKEETILQLVPDEEVRSEEEKILQSGSKERYVVKAVPKDKVVEGVDDDQKAVNTSGVMPDDATPAGVTSETPTHGPPVDTQLPVIEQQPFPAASPPHETADNGTVADQAEGTEPEVRVPETPPNKTEQEIPSFREWTQKALEEEQKKREEEKRRKDEEREKKKQQQQLQQQQKQNEAAGGTNGSNNTAAGAANGANTARQVQQQQAATPARPKKNFASPDCGAKILAANVESQGASNVLTNFRDEYMLNKCTDKAWFVVELCESIKALKIELANFELYSSVPHEFRVSLGNVFPGRDNAWTTFGVFQAADERALQAFTAASGSGDVFGKYVKVEILSHHGSEHYCPISQFKIYGISEIELIGSDDDDDKSDDDSGDEVNELSGPDVDTLATGTIVNEPQPAVTNNNNNNFLWFIKEGFQKFVGVFKPRDQNTEINMTEALNTTSLVGTSFAYEVACPGCTEETFGGVYFLLATDFFKMSQFLRGSHLGNALSKTNLCERHGINVTSPELTRGTSSSLIIGQHLVHFYTTLFGAGKIIALCNVLAIEQGRGELIQSPASKNATTASLTVSDKQETQRQAETADPNGRQVVQPPSADDLLPSNTASSNVKPSNMDTGAPSFVVSSDGSNVATDVSSVNVVVTPSSAATSTASTASSSTSAAVASTASTIDKPDVTSHHQQQQQPPIIITPGKLPAADNVESIPIAPSPVSSTASTSESSTVTVKEPELPELPEVILVPPADSSHIHGSSAEVNTDEITNGNGNGNKPFLPGQGGRESVWQKLSNRIKTLERNVTLSSGYLEELSVQYKKQIEDLQMSVRQVTESLSNSLKTRERDQFALKHLQNEVANLSSVVASLTIQMESLRSWALVAHVIVLIAEAILGSVFLVACYKRLKRQLIVPSDVIIPATASLTSQASPTMTASPIFVGKPAMRSSTTSTPLKRGYSLEVLAGDEDEDDEEARPKSSAKNGQRRLSLDNLPRGNNIKPNGMIHSNGDINLTRKQRRRMHRRLSTASSAAAAAHLVDRRIEEIRVDDLDDWTPVLRAGSVDRSTPPALETVTLLPNGRPFVPTTSVVPPFFVTGFPSTCISTSNPFGVLNSSMHDDPTPIKERSLNYLASLEPSSSTTAKKLKFSPEVIDKTSFYVDNDVDRNHLAAPKLHGRGGGVASGVVAIKRSKSTSPTRSKTQVAKQRDIFKHFNPENADWIKH